MTDPTTTYAAAAIPSAAVKGETSWIDLVYRLGRIEGRPDSLMRRFERNLVRIEQAADAGGGEPMMDRPFPWFDPATPAAGSLRRGLHFAEEFSAGRMAAAQALAGLCAEVEAHLANFAVRDEQAVANRDGVVRADPATTSARAARLVAPRAGSQRAPARVHRHGTDRRDRLRGEPRPVSAAERSAPRAAAI